MSASSSTSNHFDNQNLMTRIPNKITITVHRRHTYNWTLTGAFDCERQKHLFHVKFFFFAPTFAAHCHRFFGRWFHSPDANSIFTGPTKTQLWFGILVHSLESMAITEQKIAASKTSMTHILSTTRAYRSENCERSSVESAFLMVYVGHFNNIFPYTHSAKISNEHVSVKTLLRPEF